MIVTFNQCQVLNINEINKISYKEKKEKKERKKKKKNSCRLGNFVYFSLCVSLRQYVLFFFFLNWVVCIV